jgi:hypothetical protein
MKLLALLLALSAGQSGSAAEQLTQARARWTAVGPAEYEYVFSLDGLSHSPPFPEVVRCRVRRDEASIEPITWQNPMGARDLPSAARIDQFFLPYCGVERLFKLIDTFLQKSERGRRPVTEYDPTLGYPTRIVIDPFVWVSDDELSIWVRDFRTSRP